jgi:predicted nucleotidyltransferase
MERASEPSLLEHLVSKLRKHLPALRAEYGVRALAIFGSYARGTQAEDSDLDLLVEFEEGTPLTLIGFIGLQYSLSDLLGVEVDLVERKGLKRSISERVEREALAV